MRSKEYGMSDKTVDELLTALKSNESLKCMFAVKYCALKRITDKIVIQEIILLKSSNLAEWNSCKISDCAKACLHILGIEQYTGTDKRVQVLIDTLFFTEN